MTIRLTIDGRTSMAEEGTTILQAARDLGIEIPTLCHNDAVKPYGACRLCLVEVSDGKGWSEIVTSCNYEVWEGLQVDTRSDPVVAARRDVLDLLLSAHPNARAVCTLAGQYGVAEPTFSGDPDDDCILCGLCVRVCEQVVGVSALGFSGRGPARRMVSPFNAPSPACIGCGSCVYVCPTECLHIVDEGDKRILFKQDRDNVFKEFTLLPCVRCGRPFLPKEQLSYVKKRFKLPGKIARTCPTCGGPRL